MSDSDREARIQQLRRLVQSGDYQVDPQDVAASIVRDSEKEDVVEEIPPMSKTANTGKP